MKTVFLQVLDMSVSASILAAVVIALRLVLKKAPKAIHCALWAMVALRLVCPSLPESQASLMPESRPVTSVVQVQPQQQAPVTDARPPVQTPQATITESKPTVTPEPEKTVDWMQILSIVWLSGIGAMALYGVGSYVVLRQKVSPAIKEDGVWLCDNVASPFILGIFRPRIYLPSGLEKEYQSSVLAHEKGHLRRKDHWWKPLGFALLTVHWFNPVMWIAYVLLCRDIEAACDERVVKGMEPGERKVYSEALLSCAAPRRSIAACPLAFGEQGVKGRIKSVLSYKKPTIWIILAAVVASVAVGVFFLTNPMRDKGGDVVEYKSPSNSEKLYVDSWVELTQYYPDYFGRNHRIDVEVFAWEEDNDIWCGFIPIGDRPITQEVLDNVQAIQLSNAGEFLINSSFNAKKVHILGSFPLLNSSDGQLCPDDILELYLMERLFLSGGFSMRGSNLQYDDYLKGQSRSYVSTGEFVDASQVGVLLAEKLVIPSCLFGMDRPEYDVYSVMGNGSAYLAVFSDKDQTYRLFKQIEPSYDEGKRLQLVMNMTVVHSVPSGLAFESDCFYATDSGRALYRVYCGDMEGLYEGQSIRVTYLADSKVTVNKPQPPGGWSPQYEITATDVEYEPDRNEYVANVYFQLFDEPVFEGLTVNTDQSMSYYAVSVTQEELDVLQGLHGERQWWDPAIFSSLGWYDGAMNVVVDGKWNQWTLYRNGILTEKGCSFFTEEEGKLVDALIQRAALSDEAQNYFTDDWVVYQQMTKQ